MQISERLVDKQRKNAKFGDGPLKMKTLQLLIKKSLMNVCAVGTGSSKLFGKTALPRSSCFFLIKNINVTVFADFFYLFLFIDRFSSSIAYK